jgi:thioredoxin-related protein
MKYTIRILAFLLLAFSNIYAQNPVKSIPEFLFYRLDNRKFTKQNIQPGKKVFFVFFDSDCDHCQRAVLDINKNQKEFKNVAVYLVSLDDEQKINHFMTCYGPELKGRKNVTILLDPKNNFLPKFKPRKYPSMFLFAKDGKLITYEDNPENVFRIINQIKTFNK